MKGSVKFAAAVTVALGMLAFAGTARATTFCVPGYFDACPDDGTNALSIGSGPGPKLESAMAIDGSDGVPDTVYLDSGTYVDIDSFKASGSDDLTVIGNGREKTFLTSGTTGNSYVVDLVTGNLRHVTMKDLAIVVPENFPNGPGYGSGAQSRGDDFESVDMIDENADAVNGGSSGFANVTDGGSFTDVRVFGRNGARFSRAFDSFGCGSGQVTIDGASFSGSRYGVLASCPDMPVTVDRASFSGVDAAFAVGGGAHLRASNVLIESGAQVPIDLYSDDHLGATVADIDHATIVATGDASLPAIRAKVASSAAATDPVEVNLSNSIVAGFENTWQLTAPADDVLGDVSLVARYSSFDPAAAVSGDVSVDASTGNLHGSPGFAGITDYRLKVGAPTVDAGDPAAGGAELDLEGNARPIDGDYDGRAVRDMGAYELDPPPRSCPDDPSACPEGRVVPPRISKVRFRFRSGRGGALSMVLSKDARVRAVFTPVPRKAKKGKRRKVVRIVRKVKQGPVRIELGKRRLRPGRYRIAVTATDEAGNRSNRARIKGKAKRAKRRAAHR